MLMFENGLLTTFIPEIFMVFGFVLCLFTPAFNAQHSSTEQTQYIVQISTVGHQQLSTYQVSIVDFQTNSEAISDLKPVIPRFTGNILIFESTFSTSDGLNYVDFSRPPPSFCI